MKSNMKKYYWQSTTLIGVEAESKEEARKIALEELDSHMDYERKSWRETITEVEPAPNHQDCQDNINKAFNVRKPKHNTVDKQE